MTPSRAPMDHCIVYHHAEAMGRSFRSDPPRATNDFSIVTKKSTERLAGNAIWLISGEGQPREYRLEYWFIAEATESLDADDGDRFSSRVTGRTGVVLPGLALTDLPWFKSLKARAGNFGLGLTRIPDDYAERLGELVASHGLRSPASLLSTGTRDTRPKEPIRAAPPMNGLVIRDPYLTWILEGAKTWEIRGAATKIRGRIALIKSKSGHVFGTADLVDVIGPLSLADLRKNAGKLNRTRAEITELYYPNTHAWVLANARPLRKPIPYDHPSGAVIWVRLADDVTAKLGRSARA